MASAGPIPRAAIARYQDLDARRYQRKRARDRSLLFVAATRAREDLAIFWHGEPSPFLASTWNASGDTAVTRGQGVPAPATRVRDPARFSGGRRD